MGKKYASKGVLKVGHLGRFGEVAIGGVPLPCYKGRAIKAMYGIFTVYHIFTYAFTAMKNQPFMYPKDHWTLNTGYFEDPTPSIQVQTLPLEGPRSLGQENIPFPWMVWEWTGIPGYLEIIKTKEQ